MALPKKDLNPAMPTPAEFVREANKKPASDKGKRITLYLPIAVDEKFTALATKNNVSKTVILKTLLAAFEQLDVNEQNRLLFDAIRGK